MSEAEVPANTSAGYELPEAESTAMARPAGPGLAMKMLYGIGDVSNAVKMVVFGLFILFFYTSVMGLPASIVGAVAACGLVWDAIVDPLIGHFSDNLKSRYGRRHPLMFIGAAGMGVSMWALLSPPQGLDTTGLVIWLIVTSLLVRTMTSFFTVPYLALGAEMASDYHQRNSVSAFRSASALFGTMAAAGLSFVLFFPNTEPGVDPKLSYEGYPAMGMAFGVLITLVAAITSASTWKWRNVQPAALPGREIAPMSFFRSMAVSLANPSFRALFLSFSLFFLAVVINATVSLFFFTHYVEITESSTISMLQGGFYGGAFVGAIFWLRVSRRMEKRWLYLTGTLVTSGAMAAGVLLFGEGSLFGVRNVPPLLAGYMVVGFFASTLWVMPPSMIADVADEDELHTGRRREGSYYGMYNLGQQLAAGGSLVATGVLIDWYAGLVSGQAEQSALTVQRIGVTFGLVPAVLLVVAAFLIFRYTLDRGRVESIQRSLHKMRAGEGDTG